MHELQLYRENEISNLHRENSSNNNDTTNTRFDQFKCMNQTEAMRVDGVYIKTSLTDEFISGEFDAAGRDKRKG